jgi:hypothetical protein
MLQLLIGSTFFLHLFVKSPLYPNPRPDVSPSRHVFSNFAAKLMSERTLRTQKGSPVEMSSLQGKSFPSSKDLYLHSPYVTIFLPVEIFPSVQNSRTYEGASLPHLTGSRLFILASLVFTCVPSTLKAGSTQGVPPPSIVDISPAGTQWTATKAEHIYGLPDIKPHKQGTLTLSADALTFTGKAGSTAIQRSAVTAVSAGNERVELWGMTGRIMRMAIPDNGGLAVAAFAHHRIDMLTVEFTDSRGGAHSAVFFLGANQAAQALQSFALAPKALRAATTSACENAITEPGSMLIVEPDWHGAQVPAVYQGLVYEHLMERFRKARNLTKVYREGETIPAGLCPQYTVHLSVTGFKEGSSVKRAMLGPVGMFVGTTQMVFDADLSDRTGKVNIKEEVKITMRGEGESTNAADGIAKKFVKKYDKAVRADEKKLRKAADAAKV